MLRHRCYSGKKKRLFTKRFFPAGNYTWTVPPGCEEVDVFIVGGGGGGVYSGGGGGGYTKTYKKDTAGWRDGNSLSVVSGQSISVIVGKGGSYNSNGGYSQFMNSSYRANGGYCGGGLNGAEGGNGGSGGSAFSVISQSGGTDGSDGKNGYDGSGNYSKGIGQGHTTRDFGELAGKRNAGGGAGYYLSYAGIGGVSDYTDGRGKSIPSSPYTGGGGYGGGGGGGTAGGDGTVFIRYWAYTE